MLVINRRVSQTWPKALKLMLQFQSNSIIFHQHHLRCFNYVASWSLHWWQNGNDPLIRDLMDTTRSYFWIVYPKCYQLWTIMIIDSMDIKWYQYCQYLFGHGRCSNESALVGPEVPTTHNQEQLIPGAPRRTGWNAEIVSVPWGAAKLNWRMQLWQLYQTIPSGKLT